MSFRSRAEIFVITVCVSLRRRRIYPPWNPTHDPRIFRTLQRGCCCPPSFYSSLNPAAWFPIPPTFCRLYFLPDPFCRFLLASPSRVDPYLRWKRLRVPALERVPRVFEDREYLLSVVRLIYQRRNLVVRLDLFPAGRKMPGIWIFEEREKQSGISFLFYRGDSQSLFSPVPLD